MIAVIADTASRGSTGVDPLTDDATLKCDCCKCGILDGLRHMVAVRIFELVLTQILRSGVDLIRFAVEIDEEIYVVHPTINDPVSAAREFIFPPCRHLIA